MTTLRPPTPQKRSTSDPGEPLADALEVVAAALRAGLAPAAALTLMKETTSWGAHESARVAAVQRRMRLGQQTKEAWCGPGDVGGTPVSCRAVGSLWDLALQTGGPLASAVDDIAVHLRDEARLRGRLEALAAGPRTSRRLLSLLPLGGPFIAVLVGADLEELYTSSVAGVASVAIGLLLTGVGWWWSRTMVERAARPRAYPVAEPSPVAAPSTPLRPPGRRTGTGTGRLGGREP